MQSELLVLHHNYICTYCNSSATGEMINAYSLLHLSKNSAHILTLYSSVVSQCMAFTLTCLNEMTAPLLVTCLNYIHLLVPPWAGLP